MPTTITGTNGVNQVAPNSVDFADLKNTLFNGLLSTNGYVKIPVRDQGVEREMIIQWATVGAIGSNSSVSAAFPIAFPNAVLAVSPSRKSSSLDSTRLPMAWQATNSTLTLYADDNGVDNATYIAIGY